MSTQPSEAFPWKGHEGPPDLILDANEKPVCLLFGWEGETDSESPGVAERRRMIQEIPAMLELLEDLHGCGEVDPSRAGEILDRIEGKQ